MLLSLIHEPVFLSLNLLDWTALAAFGTLALAAVTVWTVLTDRHRTDKRDRIARIAQEDRDARQVVIHLNPGYQQVLVYTPHSYPIKWVDGCWVHLAGGQVVINRFGHAHDDPQYDKDERTYYVFHAKSDHANAQAAIHFIDWRGNLYYQYRGYTRWFPPDTDFPQAVTEIERWLAAGPRADKLDYSRHPGSRMLRPYEEPAPVRSAWLAWRGLCWLAWKARRQSTAGARYG
jgi:hypothetical protein